MKSNPNIRATEVTSRRGKCYNRYRRVRVRRELVLDTDDDDVEERWHVPELGGREREKIGGSRRLSQVSQAIVMRTALWRREHTHIPVLDVAVACDPNPKWPVLR